MYAYLVRRVPHKQRQGCSYLVQAGEVIALPWAANPQLSYPITHNPTTTHRQLEQASRTMMLRRGVWQSGRRLAVQSGSTTRRGLHHCSPQQALVSSLPRRPALCQHDRMQMLTPVHFQRLDNRAIRAFASMPSPISTAMQEDEKKSEEEEPTTTPEPEPPTPLFSSPAPVCQRRWARCQYF